MINLNKISDYAEAIHSKLDLRKKPKTKTTAVKNKGGQKPSKKRKKVNGHLRFSESKFIEPSVAEQKIIDALKKRNVPFYREVMFEGCATSSGIHYRFDFYFPERKLIIEYDGKSHEKDSVIWRDNFKDRFARKNGLRVLRFSGRDFFYIDSLIAKEFIV